MKRLLTALWVPLLIELANVLLHRVLRGDSEGITPIDLISMGITVVVVFYVGWTVARRFDRFGIAILGALLIWICSTLAVVALVTAESMFASAPSAAGEPVVTGFLLSSLLVIFPVFVVVSAVAAGLARRNRPSSGTASD